VRVGRGDIPRQRARRRNRYRGCPVCGLRGSQCTECGLGAKLVALHGLTDMALVVDGSFMSPLQVDGPLVGPPQDSNGHGGTGLASPQDSSGHGGAGLVLLRGKEVLASRACGFSATSSSDAELHAVIRAARWAPGVPIYTDVRELPAKMALINPALVVHYLAPGRRGVAYALAHRLSIEGRCRVAPQTTPRLGIEFAAERPQHSRAGRRRMAAELLLARALRDPNFSGDFSAIAAQLGWTSGPRWKDNPAIRIASQLWLEQQEMRGETVQRCQDP
jgi:hypothetical protein